jgi:hypothetical protein
MTMGRSQVAAAIAGLVMIAAGCRTMGPLQGTDLPRDVRIVGGGFVINWDAPVAGTVYLVERTSGKTIETRSVEEGDTYDFEMSLDDESVVQTFERAFGVPMKQAKLALYFKPAPSESETP